MSKTNSRVRINKSNQTTVNDKKPNNTKPEEETLKLQNWILILLTFFTVLVACFEGCQLCIQNSNTKNQNQLIEAERRSSLIFLLNNIFDAIDTELKSDADKRELSDELISRIIGLSYKLLPYQKLEDNVFDARKYSPEKGLLLATLLNSKISAKSMSKILQKANFQYSDLSEYEFQLATLDSVNLSYSNLTRTNLNGAYLRGSILHNCTFYKTKLHSAHLHNAEIKSQLDSCDLREAILFKTKFFNSKIYDSWFDNAQFELCYLNEITMRNVSIKHSDFERANYIDKPLTNFNQKINDVMDVRIEGRFSGQLDLRLENTNKFNFDLDGLQIDSMANLLKSQFILANYEFVESSNGIVLVKLGEGGLHSYPQD